MNNSENIRLMNEINDVAQSNLKDRDVIILKLTTAMKGLIQEREDLEQGLRELHDQMEFVTSKAAENKEFKIKYKNLCKEMKEQKCVLDSQSSEISMLKLQLQSLNVDVFDRGRSIMNVDIWGDNFQRNSSCLADTTKYMQLPVVNDEMINEKLLPNLSLVETLKKQHTREMEELRCYFERKCSELEERYRFDVEETRQRQPANTTNSGESSMDNEYSVFQNDNEPKNRGDILNISSLSDLRAEYEELREERAMLQSMHRCMRELIIDLARHYDLSENQLQFMYSDLSLTYIHDSCGPPPMRLLDTVVNKCLSAITCEDEDEVSSSVESQLREQPQTFCILNHDENSALTKEGNFCVSFSDDTASIINDMRSQIQKSNIDLINRSSVPLLTNDIQHSPLSVTQNEIYANKTSTVTLTNRLECIIKPVDLEEKVMNVINNKNNDSNRIFSMESLLREIVEQFRILWEDCKRDESVHEIEIVKRKLKSSKEFVEQLMQEREFEREEFNRQKHALEVSLENARFQCTPKSVSALQQNILELEQNIENTSDEKEKIVKLESDLRSSSLKLVELRGIIELLEKEIYLKNSSVSEKEARLESLEKENICLHAGFKADLEILKKEESINSAAFVSHIQNLEEKLTVKQKELETAYHTQDLLAEVRAGLNSFSENITSAIRYIQQTSVNNTLDLPQDDLNRSYNDVRNVSPNSMHLEELHSLESKCTLLIKLSRESYEMYSQNIEELETERDILVVKNKELLVQISNLMTRLEVSRHRHIGNESEVEQRLIGEKEELRQELDQMLNLANVRANELSVVRQELEKTKNLVINMEKSIGETTNQEMGVLRQKIREQEETIIRFELSIPPLIDEKNREIECLRNKLDIQEKENHSSLEALNVSRRNEIESARVLAKKQDEEIQKIQGCLDQRDSLISELKLSISILNKEKQEQHLMNAKRTEEFDQTNEELNQLIIQHREILSETSQLKRQIKESEVYLEKLQSKNKRECDELYQAGVRMKLSNDEYKLKIEKQLVEKKAAEEKIHLLEEKILALETEKSEYLSKEKHLHNDIEEARTQLIQNQLEKSDLLETNNQGSEAYELQSLVNKVHKKGSEVLTLSEIVFTKDDIDANVVEERLIEILINDLRQSLDKKHAKIQSLELQLDKEKIRNDKLLERLRSKTVVGTSPTKLASVTHYKSREIELSRELILQRDVYENKIHELELLLQDKQSLVELHQETQRNLAKQLSDEQKVQRENSSLKAVEQMRTLQKFLQQNACQNAQLVNTLEMMGHTDMHSNLNSLKAQLGHFQTQMLLNDSPIVNVEQTKHHGLSASHLYAKCMRLESYRRALVWQKKYLISCHSVGYFSVPSPSSRTKTFRIVAILVLSIYRMKFLVKRWKNAANSQLRRT